MSAILQETALAAELRQTPPDEAGRSVYQPIVNLDTTEVVGYEALARGPEGSPLERPDRLFATAHACGLLTELEWACRAAQGDAAVVLATFQEARHFTPRSAARYEHLATSAAL